MPPPNENYISVAQVDFDRLSVTTFKYTEFHRSADLPPLHLVNSTIDIYHPGITAHNITAILETHIPPPQKFRTPVYIYATPGTPYLDQINTELQSLSASSEYLTIKSLSHPVHIQDSGILSWTGLNYRMESLSSPHATLDLTGYALSITLPARFVPDSHPKLAKVGLAHKNHHEFFDVFSQDFQLDIPLETILGCTPPQFNRNSLFMKDKDKTKRFKGNFAQCEVALNSVIEDFIDTIDSLKSKPQFTLQNGFNSYFKLFDKDLPKIGEFCQSEEYYDDQPYMNSCLHGILTSKIINHLEKRGIKYTLSTELSDFERARALLYADVDITNNDQIGISRYLDSASPEWTFGKKDSPKRPDQPSTHPNRWAAVLVLVALIAGLSYILVRRRRQKPRVSSLDEYTLEDFEL